MYRSILVPLDGTSFGEHALPVARGIAERTGGTLHLVHVQAATTLPTAVESLPYLIPSVAAACMEAERAYLAGVAERLEAEGVPVTTQVVVGPVAEALERCVRRCGAELVVACTHCHEGLSRFWHRGVGEQILHATAVPLLLLRPRDDVPGPDACAVRHILLPLNGLRYAEEVLEYAVPLGRCLGAHFTLLRVVAPTRVVAYTLLGEDARLSEFLLEEQQHEAQVYLERIAERLRAAGLQVRTRVVVDEEPAAGIVRGIADPDLPPVDLVAMLTHNRGTLSRLVVSSVTDGVMHRSPAPLVLFHPREVEADQVFSGLGFPRNRFDEMVEREA